MDPRELLTRKIGPLPAWGWGVGIGGLGLAFKMTRGGGGQQRETLVVPTGGSGLPSGDFIGQFDEELAASRARLDALEQRSNNNTSGANKPGPMVGFANMPRGFNLTTWILGLRKKFPRIARRVVVEARKGETAAQRQQRLLRELPAYGITGGSFNLGIYVRGLRARYPEVARLFTERAAEGETVEQRTARLWREVTHFAQFGRTVIAPPPITPPASGNSVP